VWFLPIPRWFDDALRIGRRQPTLARAVVHCRKLISARGVPLHACGDARTGTALAVEAVCAAGHRVPLSAGDPVQLQIDSTVPSTAAASATPSNRTERPRPDGSVEAASSQDAAAERATFQLHLPEDGVAAATCVPPDWQHALDDVANRGPTLPDAAPVVIVTGSKAAGKSTFSRLLVNSLLNRWPRVAYLDTDCGQPEFTAPGEAPCSNLAPAACIHVLQALTLPCIAGAWSCACCQTGMRCPVLLAKQGQLYPRVPRPFESRPLAPGALWAL
jgi:mRNA cleavage and polyadenylation factor CLP1 P-loop